MPFLISDLEIREHYADTAGFTDHVFALMHLLGVAFCPRIRVLRDKKLFIKGKVYQFPALPSLISTTSLNLKEIEIHWREVLHLAASIKQETVTASLMLEKLASYPRQNGLAKALREIGRIERTLFMPDWFRDPPLRRRVQAGLNKGEARNALARAVFMQRLGEIRDRKPEKSKLSRQWIDAADGCHIPVEYCLYGKSGRCPEAQRGKDQRATTIAFVPVRLGTHQSDRGLYMEKQPDTGFR